MTKSEFGNQALFKLNGCHALAVNRVGVAENVIKSFCVRGLPNQVQVVENAIKSPFLKLGLSRMHPQHLVLSTHTFEAENPQPRKGYSTFEGKMVSKSLGPCMMKRCHRLTGNFSPKRLS